MITIGILEPLAGDVIIDLIHQKIETEVQDITKENFGENHISALVKVIVIVSYALQSLLIRNCLFIIVDRYQCI